MHSPRVQWILDLVDEFIAQPQTMLDVETKYPFFTNNIIDQGLFQSVIAYEARTYKQSALFSPQLIQTNDLQSLDTVDLITAFETLERMANPRDLFMLARSYCKPSGLFLITTSTCSGFEFQALGKNAPNINPINRMNLLSIEALKDLFEEFGFEIIELSTPGRLDVETVSRFLKDNPQTDIHRFWRYIFSQRDEKTWHSLQDFLQMNCLSSHVRIAAQKK
jgi:hypothetical protein